MPFFRTASCCIVAPWLIALFSRRAAHRVGSVRAGVGLAGVAGRRMLQDQGPRPSAGGRVARYRDGESPYQARNLRAR